MISPRKKYLRCVISGAIIEGNIRDSSQRYDSSKKCKRADFLRPKDAKLLLSQDFFRLMLPPSKEDGVHVFYIIA